MSKIKVCDKHQEPFLFPVRASDDATVQEIKNLENYRCCMHGECILKIK